MRKILLSLLLVVSVFIGGQAVSPSYADAASFIGIPRTKAQLYQCAVVGNLSSKIYHLKGSSYIRSMNTSSKKCFATERQAKNAGFRAAKAR